MRSNAAGSTEWTQVRLEICSTNTMKCPNNINILSDWAGVMKHTERPAEKIDMHFNFHVEKQCSIYLWHLNISILKEKDIYEILIQHSKRNSHKIKH